MMMDSMSDTLNVGDCVRIGGGYDIPPRWLHNRDSYEGVVLGVIPNEKDESSYCVVKLEESINFEYRTGNIAVMSLRYVGVTSGSNGTVHIVLWSRSSNRRGPKAPGSGS